MQLKRLLTTLATIMATTGALALGAPAAQAAEYNPCPGGSSGPYLANQVQGAPGGYGYNCREKTYFENGRVIGYVQVFDYRFRAKPYEPITCTYSGSTSTCKRWYNA